MKAIILSAGYGTRIQPLSNRLPKPLMPVVGQPLLGHIIMKLEACKVDGIGINTHHHADMIKDFINHQPFGVPLYLSREHLILGSGGGIGGFRDFLSGEDIFLVHNGDFLSDISLQQVISSYMEQKPLCALVLHDHNPYNNVLIDTDCTIVDMRDVLRPADAARRLAYTGIAVMSSRIFNYIPEGASDIVEILLAVIRKGKEKIMGIVVEGCAWSDIGTVNNYFETHRDILVHKKPLIGNSFVPTGAVSLGEGTVTEGEMCLGGFISAGKNCLFRQGCRLENCIVWDNVTIGEGAAFQNAIIGKGWEVYPGSPAS